MRVRLLLVAISLIALISLTSVAAVNASGYNLFDSVRALFGTATPSAEIANKAPAMLPAAGFVDNTADARRADCGIPPSTSPPEWFCTPGHDQRVWLL